MYSNTSCEITSMETNAFTSQLENIHSCHPPFPQTRLNYVPAKRNMKIQTMLVSRRKVDLSWFKALKHNFAWKARFVSKFCPSQLVLRQKSKRNFTIKIACVSESRTTSRTTFQNAKGRVSSHVEYDDGSFVRFDNCHQGFKERTKGNV